MKINNTISFQALIRSTKNNKGDGIQSYSNINNTAGATAITGTTLTVAPDFVNDALQISKPLVTDESIALVAKHADTIGMASTLAPTIAEHLIDNKSDNQTKDPSEKES